MLRRFLKDRQGGLALNFGLVFGILLLLGGVAIDFTRGQSARSRLIAAADATALSAAKLALDGATDGQIRTQAQAFFKANYPNSHASVTVTPSGDRIVVQATESVPTTLMQLGGINEFNLNVRSAASKASPVEGEVALVLDYSGSMNWNGKYQAMRTAAITMIDKLIGPTAQAAGTARNLKIGLVPFSEFVYTDMKTAYIRDVHSDKQGVTVRACLDSRRFPAATEDSTPAPSDKNTKWPAPGMPALWTQAGAPPSGDLNALATDDSVCTITRRKTEDECRAELTATYGSYDSDDMHRCRHQSITTTSDLSTSDQCQKTYTSDEKDTQADEAAVSDFASSSPQCAVYRDRNIVVTPLTSDASALTTQLNAMTPVRLTNIALGLEMGWHLVSNNQPFTQGAPYGNRQLKKFIVLLTDGAQTVGGWGPGGAHSIAQADMNTEALCSAIKAKGITMITVAFDLADAATRTRLQNCASGPELYFDAATNTDLATAFENITSALITPVHLVE